jgi:hypothetical protein
MEATLCALEIHGIGPQAREQVVESYRCHERAVSLRYDISQVETNTMGLVKSSTRLRLEMYLPQCWKDYGLELRSSRRRNHLHGSRATES